MFIRIGNLPQLTYLDVSVNQLKSVSFSLGYCATLKTLLLYENPLIEPPISEITKSIEIIKWYLKNKYLILNYNSKPPEMKFNTIGIQNEVTLLRPDYIDRINHLIEIAKKSRILNLQFMNITELPPQIIHVSNYAGLSLMKRLQLDYNPSLAMSNEIGFTKYDKFINLKTLSFKSCNVKKLPETISNLKSLKTLVCEYNCMETIPEGILNLKSLSQLG